MIFSIRESKELHENDSDLLEDVAVLGSLELRFSFGLNLWIFCKKRSLIWRGRSKALRSLKWLLCGTT